MQNLPFLRARRGLSTEELLGLEGRFRIDSLVLAFEEALDGMTPLSEPERVVLAVEAIEREVNNGGFWQFLCNSSGDYAHVAPEALRAIGAPRTAGLVEAAISTVAEGRDIGVDELRARAEIASATVKEKLDGLDLQYFQRLEEPLDEKLFLYIKRNRTLINTKRQ